MRKNAADQLKAVMLLGTLKAAPTLSNTDTLCGIFAEHLANFGAKSEIIRLVDYRIEPGIETDVSKKDDWPAILKRVLSADIIIFATPIWWGLQSSLIQRVIERMDALND